MISPFSHPRFEFWLRHPVEVLSPVTEINDNVNVGSPGFIPRDYRFSPKLKLGSSTGSPSDYQMFCAWQVHNELQAHRRNRSALIERVRSIHALDRKQFKQRLERGKEQTLFDPLIRRNIINLVTIGLENELSSGLESFVGDYDRLLVALNFDADKYPQPVYRRFRDIVLGLTEFIFRVRFGMTAKMVRDCFPLDYDSLGTDPGRSMDLLGELVILDKAIKNNINVLTERMIPDEH